MPSGPGVTGHSTIGVRKMKTRTRRIAAVLVLVAIAAVITAAWAYTPKPTQRASYDDYAIVSGAQADQTVLSGAGGVACVTILVAGAASSYVEVYDGTVAAGTRIGRVDGTVAGNYDAPDAWCKSSVHVKAVDSGGNMVARVTGYFR